MATEMIINSSLDPVTEVLCTILDEIAETISAARQVLIEKESFAELSSYLERIVPVLKELSKRNLHNPQSLKNTTEILYKEVKIAKQLISECSKKNKVYLLVNCRRIVKRLENTTREISRALTCIPLAYVDLSSSIKEEINRLCDNMVKAEFRVAVGEEQVLEKIELGIKERSVDRSYANNLLALIAETVGISTDKTALKKEFEEFKNELADVQQKKDQAEVIQMEQIIALLGRADAASSPREKEIIYLSRRNSLGNRPLDHLPSMFCPITRDVMVDPVETSSGRTFERSAIEECFANGNTMCPLTMIPLDRGILRPNITLRKSIEEWNNRNTMITITSIKPKLSSGEEQEVINCLSQLQDLCEERDEHREWVVLENYVPVLIELLGRKNAEIRNRALTILGILAKDNDGNKERIAKVENAIEFIVRSLARSAAEANLAVKLLCELSKHDMVLDCIGEVKGCILLLVRISKGDNAQTAKDARELLENLSVLDQNVVQMAKAYYFKPLLLRLSSGSDAVKIFMVRTLAEMELTDHSKSILFEDGVLTPLLHLVASDDIEAKEVAAKALQNFSSLPQNGLQMIREGAVTPLLDLLYRQISSSPSLRESVASTIMNLAISATTPEANRTQVSFLESDDDIWKLLALINLTGPNVQQSILQTFHAMCRLPLATEMRAKLRQCSAVQVLVQLCAHNNLIIRANAVKLFFCLTEDGDDGTLEEHVDQNCLEKLLDIIKTSKDEEEKAAAMGIISNLPTNHTQMTQWLLDAEALPIIVNFLTNASYNSSSRNQLTENAVKSLCRFTVPGEPEWQLRAAETGIIPVLVQLLRSGTALTKQNAAISLAQFSDNSGGLSRPIQRQRGLFCCCTPQETGCPVHMGLCTVDSSYCLVEVGAVEPLVRVLGEHNIGSSMAALQALSTLIDGERLQSGSKVIDDVEGIAAIVNLLSSHSAELQEAALHVLERVFRLLEFKQKYGRSAQMPLVDITQRGNAAMKPLAGRILGHLNVIPSLSSYF